MSINYRLTPMNDNISKQAKKGYYAQAVTKGTVDTATLCRDIAAECTLTIADMRAAIAALSQSIANRLLNGYNVYLDGIGTFSISAESKLVESQKDMSSKDIKVKSINYRSAVSLKEEMKNSSFVKIKEKKN